jgi:mannitol-1-/sugar-/sorbitol-6-phosphatase
MTHRVRLRFTVAGSGRRSIHFGHESKVDSQWLGARRPVSAPARPLRHRAEYGGAVQHPAQPSRLELPCRGLLFDSDGVLVDSDASVALSWTRWARHHGFDPDHVAGLVHGRRSADTVALLVPEAGRAEALAMVDRFEVEDAAAVTACPGARELVAGLPDRAWAVVTSAVRPLAEARLAAAGLSRPDVLVTADDVERGKPAPDGYRRAAALLGLPVTECLVLEDSAAGVAAGRAAGARVLGVSRRALDTDADVVVADLRGLQFDGTAVQVEGGAVLHR